MQAYKKVKNKNDQEKSGQEKTDQEKGDQEMSDQEMSNDLDGLTQIAELASRQLERQFEIIDALDQKAGIVATAAVILLRLSTGGATEEPLFLFALCFFMASAVAGVLALRPLGWVFTPRPKWLEERAKESEEPTTVLRAIIRDAPIAWEENDRRIEGKARQLNAAILSLVTGVFSLLLLAMDLGRRYPCLFVVFVLAFLLVIGWFLYKKESPIEPERTRDAGQRE